MGNFKLSPSSAHRRMKCPGSWRLENQCPDENKSQAAKEGETAHLVAKLLLNNKPVNAGDLLENGEVVTNDMIYGATVYVNDVNNNAPINYNYFSVEEKLKIPRIHPQCEGTPDLWAFSETHKHLAIWDYKFGHRYVDAVRNWQLIAYAAGIFDLINLDYKNVIVDFRIVQPRCFTKEGTVRNWAVTGGELIDYFNQLEYSEHAATKPEALCIPCAECYFCKARAACPALQSAVYAAMDYSKENELDVLDSIALSKELKYVQSTIELLKARETGLSEQALNLILKGNNVPDFTLENGQGRQVWSKSITEVISLGKLFNINLEKPQDAITPKQAIDLGLPANLVNQCSETKTGALKLVPLNFNKIKNIFSK